MATYTSAGTQSLTEIRTHVFDFTDDLLTGVTVSGASATHTPPSGSAGTPTIAVSSPYANITLGTLTVAGVHVLGVLGTLSDGNTSYIEARIIVPAAAAAILARSGLDDLRLELRTLTDCGESDYSIGRETYWTDKQLDDVLDRHRVDVRFVELSAQDTYIGGGSVAYYDYYSQYGNLEKTTGGTSIFQVQDSVGNNQATTLWTADYRRGVVTFSADTTGSAMFVTGRSYDLYAAAADIWRRKASHVAMSYDIQTDNHSLTRSQMKKHCVEMAQYYGSLVGSKDGSGVNVIELVRGDM